MHMDKLNRMPSGPCESVFCKCTGTPPAALRSPPAAELAPDPSGRAFSSPFTAFAAADAAGAGMAERMSPASAACSLVGVSAEALADGRIPVLGESCDSRSAPESAAESSAAEGAGGGGLDADAEAAELHRAIASLWYRAQRNQPLHAKLHMIQLPHSDGQVA